MVQCFVPCYPISVPCFHLSLLVDAKPMLGYMTQFVPTVFQVAYDFWVTGYEVVAINLCLSELFHICSKRFQVKRGNEVRSGQKYATTAT